MGRSAWSEALPVRDYTLRTIEDATLPPHPRYRKICVNYLGHQGTNEMAGVPTDQDARPADSVANALGGLVSSGVAPSCYRS